jgi:hypothetical protein
MGYDHGADSEGDTPDQVHELQPARRTVWQASQVERLLFGRAHPEKLIRAP